MGSGYESIKGPLRVSQTSFPSSFEGCQLSLLIFYSQEPRVCVLPFPPGSIQLPELPHFPAMPSFQRDRKTCCPRAVILSVGGQVTGKGASRFPGISAKRKQKRYGRDFGQPAWRSRGWPGRGSGEGQLEIMLSCWLPRIISEYTRDFEAEGDCSLPFKSHVMSRK